MKFSENIIHNYLMLGSELYPLLKEMILDDKYRRIKFPTIKERSIRYNLEDLFDIAPFGEEFPPKFEIDDIPSTIYGYIKKTKGDTAKQIVHLGFIARFWWDTRKNIFLKRRISEELMEIICKLDENYNGIKKTILETIEKYQKRRYKKNLINSILPKFAQDLSLKLPIEQIIQNETAQHVILFITSHPYDDNYDRLLKEIATIENEKEISKLRDKFEFHAVFQTQIEHLTRHIKKYKPNIIHFSVVGNKTKKIQLYSESGDTFSISPETLAMTIKSSRLNIKYVIMNTCFTEDYAKELSHYVDYIIGTEKTFETKYTVDFARGFYRALFDGEQVHEAVDSGNVEVNLKSDKIYQEIIRCYPVKKKTSHNSKNGLEG